MNKENTEKFFKTFSFFHPEKSLQESLMSFGFECRDGWKDLLWELCEKIEKELNENPELKENFEVLQVKEKFGGLRFYIIDGNDNINDSIDEAEEKSYTVCEVCGSPVSEQTKINGWVSTVCEKCKNIPRSW